MEWTKHEQNLIHEVMEMAYEQGIEEGRRQAMEELKQSEPFPALSRFAMEADGVAGGGSFCDDPVGSVCSSIQDDPVGFEPLPGFAPNCPEVCGNCMYWRKGATRSDTFCGLSWYRTEPGDVCRFREEDSDDD